MQIPTFKVGDLVRLQKDISQSKKTAKIVRFYTDIDGGVILDREIGGSKYWNIDCLDKVKADKVKTEEKK